MIATKLKSILLVAATSLIMGCTSGLFTGNQPYAPEVVSELIAKGASLSASLEAYPETVNASLVEGEPASVDAGDLSLKFWFETTDQFDSSVGTFYFSFSESTDTGFNLLRNLYLSNNGEFDVFYVELYESEVRQELSEFIDGNDFYSEFSPVLIPINATHVELRFSSEMNTDFVVVAQYALNNFEAYNRYILPIIESQNQ